MVPKQQGQGESPSGSRGRKSSAKAPKGSAKKTGKRAKKRRRGKAQPELPAFIDPAYAVLIKSPVRTQIVALGHQREISPSEFAEGSGIPLSTISPHFQALRRAGFLELVKEIPVRGTVKHMYRSSKRAYFTAVDWGKLGDSIQAGTGAAVLQDINSAVTEAMETGTFFKHDDVVLFWLSLMADETSWPEVVEVLAWTIGEIKRLAEETVNRHAEGEAKDCFPMTFAIAGFESPTESIRKQTQKKRKGQAKAKKRRKKA